MVVRMNGAATNPAATMEPAQPIGIVVEIPKPEPAGAHRLRPVAHVLFTMEGVSMDEVPCVHDWFEGRCVHCLRPSPHGRQSEKDIDFQPRGHFAKKNSVTPDSGEVKS